MKQRLLPKGFMGLNLSSIYQLTEKEYNRKIENKNYKKQKKETYPRTARSTP